MKIFSRKTSFKLFLLVLVFSLFFISISADAYVSVRGYFRSNGTYVRPYVRSNPNALKFDNYSWTPSQGLYNNSYSAPTKNYSTDWYTPSYITDPNYYLGKSLYESGSFIPSYSSGSSSSIVKKNEINVPTNAKLNYLGTGWSCNSGYKNIGDTCQKVTCVANAYLGGYNKDTCYCNEGYKVNSAGQCE